MKSKNLGSRPLLQRKGFNHCNTDPPPPHTPALFHKSCIPPSSSHLHPPIFNTTPSSQPLPPSSPHLPLALCKVVHTVAKACITAHIRSAYTDTRSGFTSSPAHAPGGRGMGGVRGEVGFSGTVGGTAGAASKQASEPHTRTYIYNAHPQRTCTHTHQTF